MIQKAGNGRILLRSAAGFQNNWSHLVAGTDLSTSLLLSTGNSFRSYRFSWNCNSLLGQPVLLRVCLHFAQLRDVDTPRIPPKRKYAKFWYHIGLVKFYANSCVVACPSRLSTHTRSSHLECLGHGTGCVFNTFAALHSRPNPIPSRPSLTVQAIRFSEIGSIWKGSEIWLLFYEVLLLAIACRKSASN